jgi:hypothetical protein
VALSGPLVIPFGKVCVAQGRPYSGCDLLNQNVSVNALHYPICHVLYT